MMTTDAERNAARDALELQNCCNLTAFVGTMHKHLCAMPFDTQGRSDNPATLAFVSKINDLCQFSVEREAEAFHEIRAIVNTTGNPQRSEEWGRTH